MVGVPSKHREHSGLFQDVLEIPVAAAPSITIHGNSPRPQLSLLSNDDSSPPRYSWHREAALPRPIPRSSAADPAQPGGLWQPHPGHTSPATGCFLITLLSSGSEGPQNTLGTCAFKNSPDDSPILARVGLGQALPLLVGVHPG